MSCKIGYNNTTKCVTICKKNDKKPGPPGPPGPPGKQGPTGPSIFTEYTISSILKKSSYTLYSNLSEYDIYQVDTSSNSIKIILPLISALKNKKRMHIFTDVGGNLTNNNLIIQTSGSDKIANNNSITLNINYSSITLISNTSITNGIWIIS